MADEQRRVQLIVERPNTTRSPFIGFGLLASLVIGFDQLGDAARGVGSFESALGRFLMIMVVCAIAGAVLGRLLDGASSKQTLDSNARVPTDTAGDLGAIADGLGAPATEENQ